MKTIEKLKSLPRHGVLPRGGRGRARVTRAAAPPRSVAPARTPQEELPVESPPEVSSVNQQIEQLAQRVAKLIINNLHEGLMLDIQPDEEEDLLAELAKCMTLLDKYLKTEQYEKCEIIKNKIKTIENKLRRL